MKMAGGNPKRLTSWEVLFLEQIPEKNRPPQNPDVVEI